MRLALKVVGSGLLAGLLGCGSTQTATPDGGGGGKGTGGESDHGGSGSRRSSSGQTASDRELGSSSRETSTSRTGRSTEESGGSSSSAGAGSSGSTAMNSGGTTSAGTTTAATATSTMSTGTTTSSAGSSTSSDPSVLQFHNHINRDGAFVDLALSETAAATFGIDSSFAGTGVSGEVYASPLYVESGVGGQGTFYVATASGTVYALDETTGGIDWQTNVGTAATQSGGGCGNISPIGITGTPAIDLATRLIVFDSATADSSGNIATHSIYALSIDTGHKMWAVDVSTLQSGTTAFTPETQNQRGAVLILDGVAYVTYGGFYGDCGTYDGWVVGVPLSGSGAQAWATTTTGAGIWGVGGPASDGTSVFVTSGNGFNDMSSWGESEGLFRLAPGPSFSGNSADYFAPYNWSTLDGEDLDLSGSGPLVIDAPSMTPSTLVLAQGKDGYLYLVSRADLGGIATMTHLANVGSLQVSEGQISNGGAWATIAGTTYVVVRPNGQNRAIGCPDETTGDLVAVKLDATSPNGMTVAWCAHSGGNGSPSITTTDGTNNAMVWAYAAEGNDQLYAWDLVSGTQVLTGATGNDSAANVRHFSTPIAVHGRIFVAGDDQLYAFAAR